jgi:hypothetical protein
MLGLNGTLDSHEVSFEGKSPEVHNGTVLGAVSLTPV